MCGRRNLPVSGILLCVRLRFFFATLTAIVLAAVLLVAARSPQAPPPVPATAVPEKAAAAQVGQSPAGPARASLATVVLDPAHGGADAGARGATGVIESEMLLVFARQIAAALETQGLRVVLTRRGNENPTFDDRAAMANGQRGALFITLHVSSTGPTGTARVYSLAPPAAAKSAGAARATASAGVEGRAGLVLWDSAQDTFRERSRQLAELVQIQLAQNFRGSPEVPALAAVRQLRTVAVPAIAVEISSVAVADRSQVEHMASPLAEGIARGVAAFRPIYDAGAK